MNAFQQINATLVSFFIAGLLIGAGGLYLRECNPLIITNTELINNINKITNKIQEVNTTNHKLNKEIQNLNTNISESMIIIKTYKNKLMELNNTIIDSYNIIELLEMELKNQYSNVSYYKSLLNCNENNSLITYNNVVIEFSKDYIVYFSGLLNEKADNNSGILIGTKEDESSSFSFSWCYTNSTPNYNSTLDEMYSVIKSKVTNKGDREKIYVNQLNAIYEIHEIQSQNERMFVGYVVWYDPDYEYYYIYAIQTTSEKVESNIHEFLETFRLIT